MENNVPNIISKIPSTILLGYGGSRAYGTQLPTSDIDIRGIYMNPLDELIGTKKDSETKEIPGEDTVLYSLKKMMSLLSGCNPNVIEILGLRPKDYLYISPEGQRLLDNKQIFLSKKAIFTFGQYAKAQLNRLVNKSGRAKDEIDNNEERSLQKAIRALGIKPDEFWIENLPEKGLTLRTSMTCSLAEFVRIYQAVDCVHTDYRSSTRNNKAIEHQKLSKHMMHLLRLYMTGIDILKNHEIITYRSTEHDLLMSIRHGDFLESDQKTPTKDFERYLKSYQKMFDDAAANSTLPERVDEEKINSLMMDIVREYYRRSEEHGI